MSKQEASGDFSFNGFDVDVKPFRYQRFKACVPSWTPELMFSRPDKPIESCLPFEALELPSPDATPQKSIFDGYAPPIPGSSFRDAERKSIYQRRGVAPLRPGSSFRGAERLSRQALFGSVALHCFHLQKGTNLQFVDRDKFLDDDGNFTGYVALKVKDPIRDSSPYLLETSFYCERHRDRWSVSTTLCRLKPQTLTPPPEVRGYYSRRPLFNENAVDELFQGDMPGWIPDITSDKLQYYEMKDSEVKEANRWLQLYTELAFYSMCEEMREVEWRMPFLFEKVIVQTRADVKKVVEAENAIFFITFKSSSDGDDFRAIIRRTTDGMPEHLSLEVNCLML